MVVRRPVVSATSHPRTILPPIPIKNFYKRRKKHLKPFICLETYEVSGPRVHPKMQDYVYLNVGRRIFLTVRGTLCKESDSMLARMFDPEAEMSPSTPCELTSEGHPVYFLDCNPDYFSAILDYLRHGTVNIDPSLITGVQDTAEYLGLISLCEICQRQLKEKEKRETKEREEREREGLADEAKILSTYIAKHDLKWAKRHHQELVQALQRPSTLERCLRLVCGAVMTSSTGFIFYQVLRRASPSTIDALANVCTAAVLVSIPGMAIAIPILLAHKFA